MHVARHPSAPRWWLAASLLATGSFTATARAQNPRDVPLGGRTATMGGAATAAGNDSAMPYLNPAGMAGIPGDVFAVSASVYSYTRRTVPDPFLPRGIASVFGPLGDGRSDFSSTDSHELPSSVMYFHHLTPPGAFHHVLGVSLVVPTLQRFEVIANGSARLPAVNGNVVENIGISRTLTQTYFGPSYALGIDDRVRLGLSAYLIYTQASLTTSTNAAIGASGIQGRLTDSAVSSLEALGFVPIVGVQVRLGDDVWIGAGGAPPGFFLSGSLEGSTSSQSIVGDSQSATIRDSVSQLRGGDDERTPARLNAGIALQHASSFALAADAHYYFPQAAVRKIGGSETVQESQTDDVPRFFTRPLENLSDSIGAFDISLGAELFVTPEVALRAGVFTDNATSPRIPEQPAPETVYQARYDRVGATLGLGLVLGSFDSTFGIVGTSASGDFVIGDSASDAAFAASRFIAIRGASTEQTVTFVVSGAVTSEQAKQQIRGAAPIGKVPGGAPIGKGALP